ncbi:hypothetical protein C5O19_24300 [Siphonobacter curvatus]|uniref:Uncharacterized protein n=1 Tax=Siphonobacter curvatus TaxID=2094562 RepID=A0A2S7IFJ6_9BACT|nr:hypothetical protein C5O19_24300 [Siphonobacter curvatus]
MKGGISKVKVSYPAPAIGGIKPNNKSFAVKTQKWMVCGTHRYIHGAIRWKALQDFVSFLQ